MTSLDLHHLNLMRGQVKAPNQHPRALQVSRHKLFEHLGFRVYVLDNKKDIEEILDEIETA